MEVTRGRFHMDIRQKLAHTEERRGKWSPRGGVWKIGTVTCLGFSIRKELNFGDF